MLRCLALRMPRGDLAELNRLCVALELKAAVGADLALESRVLAESHTTTLSAGSAKSSDWTAAAFGCTLFQLCAERRES